MSYIFGEKFETSSNNLREVDFPHYPLKISLLIIFLTVSSIIRKTDDTDLIYTL
nr:MAG TPA_asm: hypothetical protein [Caudoviricetes sp.]